MQQNPIEAFRAQVKAEGTTRHGFLNLLDMWDKLSEDDQNEYKATELKFPAATPSIIKTQEWKDFSSMRAKIKKPLTERAVTMALNELERLAPNDIEQQKQILNQSTFNCWKGLFPLKGYTKSSAGIRKASFDLGEINSMLDSGQL